MITNELTTTPMTPFEGDADPQAVLVPASSTVLVTTSTCVAAATQVVSFRTMTCLQLREYVEYRSVRCNAHIEGFRRRWTELYPALLEAEARYNKQQGARTDLHDLKEPGFHEFLASVGVPPGTYRSWKSRIAAAMKQLGEVVGPTEAGRGRKGRTARRRRSPAPASASAAVTEAEKNLVEAKTKFGPLAEGGNPQAKAYLAEYEQAHAKAVAATEATETETEEPKADLKVNKRLSAIAEVAERYIRVMERVVYSGNVTLTDRQKHDLERALQPWRKVLRDARELTWAIKTIERQEEAA